MRARKPSRRRKKQPQRSLGWLSLVCALVLAFWPAQVSTQSFVRRGYETFQNNGTPLTKRRIVNCASGVTCADDAVNFRTNITASGAASATCIDADSDTNCEVDVVGTTVVFDPDSDGVADAVIDQDGDLSLGDGVGTTPTLSMVGSGGTGILSYDSTGGGEFRPSTDFRMIEDLSLIIGGGVGSGYWELEYDEDGDDQLLLTTTKTGAAAAPDAMFQILVDSTTALGANLTADQYVFAVSKGQPGDTAVDFAPLLAVDAEGQLFMRAGSETDPTYSFHSSKDTGTFRLVPGRLAFTTAGSTALVLWDDGEANFWAPGTVGGPTIVLNSDHNSGLYQPVVAGADVLAMTLGGIEEMRWAETGGVTSTQLASLAGSGTECVQANASGVLARSGAACGGASVSPVLGMSTIGEITGTPDMYIGIGNASQAEDDVQMKVDSAMTLTKLSCQTNDIDPSADITVMARRGTCGTLSDDADDAGDGVLSCIISGTAKECQNGNDMTLTADQCWALKLSGASALSSNIIVNCLVERSS